MDTRPETDRHGFRLRGLEMTRIETFTDAAFAFALTLLVISLDPPTSFEALGSAMRDAPAFLLSATLLMVFWWGHHQWSRRYGLDDGPTIVLSCVLVFTVLLYVYPLRFVFGLMMAWIQGMSSLPLSSGEITIRGPADVNAAFAVYGVGFVAMCGALGLLHLHSWRQRDELRLSELERFDTVVSGGTWAIMAVVGLLSLGLALQVPDEWAGAPGWAYMLLPVVMPVYGALVARHRRSLEWAGAPAGAGADGGAATDSGTAYSASTRSAM